MTVSISRRHFEFSGPAAHYFLRPFHDESRPMRYDLEILSYADKELVLSVR